MLRSPGKIGNGRQTREQKIMRLFLKPGRCVWLLAICASPLCHAESTWRALDPEKTLVIDTSKGRLIVEMRPDMAPKSVERVKLLAREKIYDGLQFHRVIGHFVAQTGNPNNQDGGTSAYPNLAPEMTFKYQRNASEVWASKASDAASGFLGSVPFHTIPLSVKEQALPAWGAHCPGVMGMGRGKPLDSANSEFYFMLGGSRDMDRDYTVVGRVVVGVDVLQALNQGVPPANPDIMHSVRLLADVPAAQRPTVSLMTGKALGAFIEKVRREKAADFSICDVMVPVKMQ